MGSQNLKDKIIAQSRNDSSWLENAKYRQANNDWLSLSFKIALKILRYLRANKISQKDLASQLDWSPQYLSKVLKGKENFTLETICKIQNLIGINLIEIPVYSNQIEVEYNLNEIIFTVSVKEIKETMSYVENKESYSQNKEEVTGQINKAYLEAA